MLRKQKNKKGFTIIEVVLVLAVAGLIFLMVFVALPALQRNQRDTQRRQDYGDLSSAISGYMASNGHLPTKGTTLNPATYINSNGEDPNNVQYEIRVCEATNGTNARCNRNDNTQAALPDVIGDHVVYVVTGADCGGVYGATNGAKPSSVNSGRAFAIYGYMESTGTYCQASS